MATIVWQGGAASIAQVDTVQITGYDAGTTYKLTVGDKTVSVTGTTDADGTAAALSAAWNLSTEPEVAEITATVATDTVTLTSDTPGTSHIVTSSVAGAAGTIGAVTESVPNSGPNDVAVLTNYSSNTLPGPGDDLVCEHSSVDMLYNLDALTGNIDGFTAKSTFTGGVGLPRNNALGYVEYLPTALELGTSINNIDIGSGTGVGDGSGIMNLAVGNLTAALDVNISKTANSATPGVPAVLLTTGTQSDVTTINVNRGTVGIAFYAGETAVVDVLKIGFIESVSSDSGVIVSDGVTLTTLDVSGGVSECRANIATLNKTGGTLTIAGSATLGAGNLFGGIVYYTSVGTYTTIHNNGGSTLDFRRDARSRTGTFTFVYQGSFTYDPDETVDFTNDIDLVQCGIEDITLSIGQNFTLGKTAI